MKTDTKQNISSIRHFLKKRHWVSDVFAGMCLLVTGPYIQSGMRQFPASLVHQVTASETPVLARHDVPNVVKRDACTAIFPSKIASNGGKGGGENTEQDKK